MKSLTKNLTAIVMLILSLVLAIGSVLWFHACGAMEDGSYMPCHWAQHAVTFCGTILSVLTLLRLVLPKSRNLSRGLSLAVIVLAVGTAILPNTVIPLCMMTDMRCHSIMRPAVIVLCVLIAVASCVDLILQGKSGEQK